MTENSGRKKITIYLTNEPKINRVNMVPFQQEKGCGCNKSMNISKANVQEITKRIKFL